MQNKQCYKCVNGLQMPTGNAWCQITMSPRNECSNYESGSGKIYKIMKIIRPKENIKVKVREIKPKPIVAKPIVKANKKSSSAQQKMF